MLGEQQHPGPERAGHAGGEEPGAGTRSRPSSPERLDGGGTGRGTLSVQHKYLAAAGVEADHRHFARGPAHVRLDHLQRPAATAASKALPPCSSTARPAADASQWVEATMPNVPASCGLVVNGSAGHPCLQPKG